MVVKAYIFIIVNPGTRADVSSSKIFKEEGVKDLTEVYGQYDLILKVELPSMEDLQKFMMKFRAIEGIEKTTTMIAMR